MRQLTAILLLFTLAFPFTMRVGIVGHYVLNKAYYATVLCENKDNKDMDCEGSCRLKKELNDVQDPAAHSRKAPHKERIEISSFLLLNTFEVALPIVNCVVLHAGNNNLPIANSTADFFHPPEA